jgi:hypothetical protein
MTKKYIFGREDLQNLIHESITFFSCKAKDYLESGKTVMFSDRIKWIDEFIDNFVVSISLDEIIEKLETEESSYNGRDINKIKKDLKNKLNGYKENEDIIKEFLRTKKRD